MTYPRVACLIFALALVPGCNSKGSSRVREQPPLSSVAQEIQRRGYHVKERQILPPTPWEISTFRMRSKRSVSFRANQPQAGTREYFVRFRFFEETYGSIEDARHRLANLHLWSPDATAEVNEYDRVMRSGFRVGTVVYFLQTDAISFWDEVQRFAKELSTATPGAELTRAIISVPAEQSWDASGRSVFSQLDCCKTKHAITRGGLASGDCLSACSGVLLF